MIIIIIDELISIYIIDFTPTSFKVLSFSLNIRVIKTKFEKAY